MKAQFEALNDAAISKLCRLPAIFAYEEINQKNARIGKITKVRKRGQEYRVEYEFFDQLPEISPEMLKSLVWELEIGEYELSRTHWAVKNVDLASELINANIISESQINSLPSEDAEIFSGSPRTAPISICPTIFRVPRQPVEADLVSVMMPFQTEFNNVFQAVGQACKDLDLRCLNANQIWDETEIIQDIFSLIFRSRVVVCDFSSRNPNVFYEAGIAHTLGRDVIPIVQSSDDIPFDLRHHRYILYLNNGEGLEKLKNALSPRLAKLTKK